MAQVAIANMDGGVAEPDPKALKMMIQMVANFRGPVPRTCARMRACASVMCAVRLTRDGWIIKV